LKYHLVKNLNKIKKKYHYNIDIKVKFGLNLEEIKLFSLKRD